MDKYKNGFYALLLLFASTTVWAQQNQPSYPDSLFTTYYHQRTSLFKLLPQSKGDIIFLGNSITDGGEWSEFFNDSRIKNRGISGDFTIGVLNRMAEIYERKPAKVFLLIGINDLARNISIDSILKNILQIASLLKDKSPLTKLYVQSVFPVNEKFQKFSGHTCKRLEILEINKALFDSASKFKFQYVDVFSALADTTGRLNASYTNDGLHLTGAGYLKWKETIYDKLYDLPALIPLPQKINWSNEKYLLQASITISINNPDCQKEAIRLAKFLAKKNTSVKIIPASDAKGTQVELRIINDLPVQNKSEAFHLSVTKSSILIEATSAHGLFNGAQTLRQLFDGNEVAGCDIIDWPAFSWRGFMIDVGRNYQSVKQIKQQIDVMAAYKLNIFHLHLTEDIAWRLQSKHYPQLTAAKNMLRNPDKFYSIQELKELITYCKERYITLVPEIDMPGHSDAFKRAMGVDMQSEEGVRICKTILTELCKEIDIPFIHIGGDEVKITNKDFLPQMASLLKSYGKKIIAWDPGGNIPEGTILQMWNGNTKPKANFPAIDSRHLYLNHFDPIDGVVTTFNHQVCDVSFGDEKKIGATLCNWPDRRVENEADLINMNAVYPVMLAFAERCWHGGGWGNYLSTISSPGNLRYAAFVEFENRLLGHKNRYFKNQPFPYVKQSHIEWKLIGPFRNNGNTKMEFLPESFTFLDTVTFTNYPSVFGGTIWLRHFWHPMIQSHLQNSKDSSTYYAFRKIWNEKDEVLNFWIGFNNISRSTASDSPPAGEWDNRGSKVWVNGNIIEPPIWKRAGQKGNAETPLLDEGYEYREPTKIILQKGWNTVLIKAPVGSFKAEWNNPVKWMYTFISL